MPPYSRIRRGQASRSSPNLVCVGDELALGDQLISSFELADDLLRCVTGTFHSGVACPQSGRMRALIHR